MAAAMLSGGKRRSRSEGESDRADSEHASSPAPSSRSSTKHQIRHRASIACASCRERRIRCVVGEGESECAQCRRTGATCIIKDDDERRRPISKAYMSSLSSRINLLEEMLKERGVAPPPAVHPPKTRQEAQSRHQHEQHQGQSGSDASSNLEPSLVPPPLNPPPTPPGSGDEDVIMAEPEQPKNLSNASHAALNRLIDPLLLQEAEPKKEASTRHLLCTRGGYVFDQAVGRTRYFGPTSNSHVHTKPTCGFSPSEHLDQTHRAELVIGSLAPATHDHLMRCFSEHYNSWQRVVDESAFEAGRATQDSRFYSPFLHLAMLGIGFRFSDWDREDVKAITLGNRESTLHRETKAMVEVELEQPGGISSVQALLMLADLECGVGRDTTGWVYSGMANRLAFDIGLHANPGTDISELERQTRCQAMAACVMFDRKWAFLLGRPIAIKMQDVRVDMLPRVTSQSLADSGLATVATHSAINRQMFELLELAGKVADFQNSTYGAAHVFTTKAAEDRAYLHFIGLERLFHNWYRRLPENLTWKPANIKAAHMGFFMLHQQFHVCMILLHRPWAKYGPMSLDGAVAARYPSPGSPGQEDGTSLPSWMAPLQHHDNRASMSRSMCTQHAIRIARIFWHLRQRFDGRKVVVTAIQHAGTATLALMAALAHKSAELDHHSNLRYLQVLSSAIYDMSHLYQPAAKMYQLLKTMLVEIRSEMVKSGGFDVSTLVGRYQANSSSNNMVFGSNHWANGADSAHPPADRLGSIQEEDRATKRRRLSSLSSIDVSCLSPSFLSNMHQTCPTPPGSSQHHDTSNQAPSESSTFDMDFFHASFVDFISSGGSAPGSQDWTPPNNDSSAPIFIPTTSGDISCMNNDEANPDHQPTAPPATTTAPPAPTTPATDDDTSVDQTISDWLAEPSKSTVVPTAPNNNDTATTSHTPPPPQHQPQQQQHQPSEYPTLPATNPDPTPHRHGSLTHATADGTPICRDPYVLSLETELGIGFDLGPDPSPAAASASPLDHNDNRGEADAAAGGTIIVAGSGNGGGGGDGGAMDPMEAIDAIDWFAAASGTSAASPAATTTQSPSTGLAGSGGGVAGVSPVGGEVPVTPVTLDELVLSVEEAVGSARARARARAAASGSGCSGGVSGSAGRGSVGGGDGGNGRGGSPAVRNQELDFLVL